jgi:hypothetical protein
MRYFVVQHDQVPVAVVFHDYLDRTFSCRSTSESFLRAFNATCAKSEISFEREADLLRVIYSGPEEYDWITYILDQLDKDYWSVSDSGEVDRLEPNIDGVIAQFLS